MEAITLKQLEIFVSVAERNSFSGAAEALYLTQSTVSAHIRTLETLLGVRLFLREERRNVRLSPEGQALYPRAKRLLSESRAVQAMFRATAEPECLQLGASTVPAQYLLPDLLAGFLRRCPGGRYVLKKGDSASVHAQLRAGEIRIGFAGTALDRNEFQYTPIAHDRLVLAAPNTPRYQALLREGRCGRELLHEPTIAREEGSGTDRSVQRYMQRIGFDQSQLHILARIDDPETIKHMVMQGSGVSVLSALAIEQEVAARRLLQFEMDREGLQRDIFLVLRRDFHPTALEEQFLSFVKKQLAAGMLSK